MSFWDWLRGGSPLNGMGAVQRTKLPPASPGSQPVPPGKCYAMSLQGDGSAEITMYGEVVESHPTHWWTGKPLEGDYIAQDDFLRDLDGLSGARSITIRMNSVGGDALVGMVIHNRLRELSRKGVRLTCIVDGAAMSAASIIMCACDTVKINPSSLVMVHRCWSLLWGGYNADDLREIAAKHDAYDRAAVAAYQRRTKLPEEELLRMMSETTYLTGAEAVEKGFADELIEDAEPLEIAASADGRFLLAGGRRLPIAPGMFASGGIPTVKSEADAPVTTNTKQPVPSGGQNGGNIMANNLAELRQENPALAEQLMNEAQAAFFAAMTAGTPAGAAPSAPAASAAPAAPAPQASAAPNAAQEERQRIQEIDKLAGIFDSETIYAAKYGEHPCTAQEMVYQAAQKAAQQGRDFLAALEADTAASGAQDVGAANGSAGDGVHEKDSAQAMLAQARADAKAFNERKKEVR